MRGALPPLPRKPLLCLIIHDSWIKHGSLIFRIPLSTLPCKSHVFRKRVMKLIRSEEEWRVFGSVVTKRPKVQGREKWGVKCIKCSKVKWNNDLGWSVCIIIDLYLCSCMYEVLHKYVAVSTVRDATQICSCMYGTRCYTNMQLYVRYEVLHKYVAVGTVRGATQICSCMYGPRCYTNM
jgi:hypothetical protein